MKPDAVDEMAWGSIAALIARGLTRRLVRRARRAAAHPNAPRALALAVAILMAAQAALVLSQRSAAAPGTAAGSPSGVHVAADPAPYPPRLPAADRVAAQRAAGLVNPDSVAPATDGAELEAGQLTGEDTGTGDLLVTVRGQRVPRMLRLQAAGQYTLVPGITAAHEQATQDPRDPATTRWAVLVGVNDYMGPTRDNVGSRQDAEDLYQHLRSLGWREDHIVVLTDQIATREAVEHAIDWLARKTNGDSLAVFHYSGHTHQDDDTGALALWPSDNDWIPMGEFAARMNAVNAGRLWLDVAACEAAGYGAGLRRPGRVMTFSSTAEEKSYEDPSADNSVWGWYLVDRGMMARGADLDGNGDVTVQEAFRYAAPKAAERTDGSSAGPQHPVIVDDSDGAFSLTIPR